MKYFVNWQTVMLDADGTVWKDHKGKLGISGGVDKIFDSEEEAFAYVRGRRDYDQKVIDGKIMTPQLWFGKEIVSFDECDYFIEYVTKQHLHFGVTQITQLSVYWDEDL